MDVAFRKIGTTPKPFSVRHHAVTMEGNLQRTDVHFVTLSARIFGNITLDCDRCGRPYHRSIDEPLVLHITDTIAQNKDDLDIIEFLNGVIDLTYILEGEVQACAAAYHFCPACTQTDAPIEIEI